ncbi:hypothetical protein EV385_0906 [Krasilnikovia cinnamomea]|uniref:Uncharacterized protein n=1 Tax=Krasilnikovia cinnamomea TaxID=349313 RepID=A0A4Q7ZEL7_9ACTN|nr:hypothetical protein [Krasilnikovia cinnamomea]RZU49170.1 hypothetical protein EV385_0906 [Krasilnikovia cinnamomea]
MTDLDDLRDALQSPPGFAPRVLDLDQVMAAGGRLRRRRRLAVGAASALAVAVLLVGGGQVARLAGGPPPAPANPAQVADVPDGRVLGEVMPTGVRTGAAEWVIYAQPVELPGQSGVRFGFQLGRRSADGSLRDEVMTNDVEGSDRAPGFHAVQRAMTIDAGTTLTFGYYVGSPATITARAGGRTVTAERAVWSEDPSVTVFWFRPRDVTPNTKLTKLTAKDAQGRVLPAGDTTVGVG